MAFTNIEAIQKLNLISVDLKFLTFAMNYWKIISLGDRHNESPMIEFTRLTSLQELWEQQVVLIQKKKYLPVYNWMLWSFWKVTASLVALGNIFNGVDWSLCDRIANVR